MIGVNKMEQKEHQNQDERPVQPGLLGMFDAESYWAGKRFKKWTVTVTNGAQINTVYVASASEQGAKRQAKKNTNLTGRLRISARLATPDDLLANHRDDQNKQPMWV